ncbi:MAG: hypothetical protein ACFNNL_06885 [Kingella oralis]
MACSPKYGVRTMVGKPVAHPTACRQAVRWLKIRKQPETKNTVSGCLCPTRIKAA